MNRLIAIVGPTAVGKTKFSIEIAKHLNGEIISGDSMQVYKGMDIGTAKVTKEEAQGIPHHLINILSPNETFNASIFKSLAEKAYEKIISKNKLPILAGGTGLYVNGFLYDYQFSKSTSVSLYRKKLEDEASQNGLDSLYQKLLEISPNATYFISKNDKLRIIRALEVYYSTGKIYFDKNNMKNNYRPRFNLSYIGLNMNREELYQRINLRVDKMLEAGLIEEVMMLLSKGFDKNLIGLQAIGYKEIIKYLDKQTSLNEAIELIKKNSRNFAKRQLTWFRRDPNIHWIEIDNKKDSDVLNEMYSIICKEE